MNDLISMTLAILVPLAPAYLLYKTLPSSAEVNGPYKGLVIRLSGAFGGYFLLTLLAFGFLTSRPQPTKSHEVWQVRGKINCEHADTPINPKQLSMTMLPPNVNWGPDGTFYAAVPVARTPSGQLDFPTLMIEHPTHQTVNIDLNKKDIAFGQEVKKLIRNDESKVISVDNVISLTKRMEDYKPTGPAPLQMVGSSAEVIP